MGTESGGEEEGILYPPDEADVQLDILNVPPEAQSYIPESEQDEGFSWLYCMVFKIGDPDGELTVTSEDGQEMVLQETQQFAKRILQTLKRIRKAELCYTTYKSTQEDEIYCLLGITESRCIQEAVRTHYELRLEPDAALQYGKQIGCRLALKTVSDEDQDSECTPAHWENLYGRYEEDAAHIYERYDDDDHYENSLFKATDRLKLIVSVIESEPIVGGAGLAMGTLIKKDKNHPAIAFYPLHQNQKKETLEALWNPISSRWRQPLEHIRNYCGEYFALYFAFLECYCQWLLIPSIVGLPFFIFQVIEGNPSVPGIWILGVIISIWATVFLEYWKSREANYRVKWGQCNFKKFEQPRPEFEGVWKSSSITGKLEEQFGFFQKVLRMTLSQTVIYSLIACVIAAAIGIFIFKHTQRNDPSSPIYTGFVNAVQIQIFNFIYSYVSEKLNNRENHRTDSEYENAMIAKSFLFKFVNSFNTLFYIAFFKWTLGDECKETDDLSKGEVCLSELQTQLATLFASMIILNNVTEYLKPKIMNKMTGKKQGLSSGKTDAEKQFELTESDSMFGNYDELIIQFGFVTLFIIATPITPLLALLNNFIETWLDSRKITRLFRRPEPRGVYDIGTWRTILELMSIITVVTNAAIIVFVTSNLRDFSDSDTGEYRNGYDKWTNVWIFVVVEHTVLLFKFAIRYFLPDQSIAVTNHIARQEYIIDALLNHKEDEDDAGPGLHHWEDEQKDNERDFEADIKGIRVGCEADDHTINPS